MTKEEKILMYDRYTKAYYAARDIHGKTKPKGLPPSVSELHVHPDNKSSLIEVLGGSEGRLNAIGITIFTDDSMTLQQIAFSFKEHAV